MFYFGDHLIHPSTSDLIPHPPILLTHTHTPIQAHSVKQPFALIPLYSQPHSHQTVLKPNPEPSSTKLGYLLTSHSAAKRPTETLTKPSV